MGQVFMKRATNHVFNFWKNTLNLFMVVKSLENLEKSGNKLCVREKPENLEKSENFTERAQSNSLCIFIICNNAFSDKNFHYAHLNSRIAAYKYRGIFWNFVWITWKSPRKIYLQTFDNHAEYIHFYPSSLTFNGLQVNVLTQAYR